MRLEDTQARPWSAAEFRATARWVRSWWRANMPYRRASGWRTPKGKA